MAGDFCGFFDEMMTKFAIRPANRRECDHESMRFETETVQAIIPYYILRARARKGSDGF